MGHRLLELAFVVLLGFTLVQCQGEMDLEFHLPEKDMELDGGDDSTGEEKNVKEKIFCPEKCSCSVEGSVDCNGVSLTEFPEELSEHTRQLSLQKYVMMSFQTLCDFCGTQMEIRKKIQRVWKDVTNNQIAEVTLEHLSHLQQLETLNLQNNRLTTQGLDDEAFHILERLSYLYLANNKLTAAPRQLPPSLVSADFAANHLTKIYPNTFGHKPALKSVYLHNNKLTDAGLPENMFNGSNSLEILIMSSNFLRYVPQDLPKAIYRLHLKNNKLEKIPAGAFDHLIHLRELYLQNNFLSNDGIDNETFSNLNRLEYLELSNNNLTAIPLGLPRNLILLHLEKNSIQGISANALTPIRNLEYLLLHNNKLRSRFIHPAAFQGLKRLHTVHMYNNLLERVPRGLPRRAKTLMLLHNHISEIGRNDLIMLYTLTELNLSYNRLTSAKLHRESFRKLRILETLDLSGNKLQTLPLGLPKSLLILKVKDNQMTEIPEGSLLGMSKLKELYLSNNQLKLNSFYQGAWQELSALTTLDLSGNLLTHIPGDLPESLEYLHLQNNRISTVTSTAFLNTPNIKGIFLRFNRLSVHPVSEESFSHLSKLQVLDIGHGNISPNRGQEEEEEVLPDGENEDEDP